MSDSHTYFLIDYSNMTTLNTVTNASKYYEKMIHVSWSTSSSILFYFNGSSSTYNYLHKFIHNSGSYLINTTFEKGTYGTFIHVSEISTVKYLAYLSSNKKVYIMDNNLNLQWETDISTNFPDATMIAWSEGQIYAAIGQTAAYSLHAENIVKFNKFCHSSCNSCEIFPTSTSHNCLTCKDGYTLQGSQCYVDCPADQYSNENGDECLPCLEDCCWECSIPGLVPKDFSELTCQNEIPNNYSFLNSECTKIDYQITLTLDESKTTLKIDLDHEPINFNPESNISITTSNSWAKEIDFDYEITEISEKQWQIKFNYLKLEYNELITINVQGVTSLKPDGGTYSYPEASTSFQILLFVPQTLGISNESAERISQTTGNVAEFGQFFILLIPGLSAFVAPLNSLKLAALYPIQFSLRFVKFLQLLVTFSEEDFLAKSFQTEDFYSQDYIKQKRYVPMNRYFQFVSIYPRIRSMKILLRIFMNIMFFVFSSKISETVVKFEKMLKQNREKQRKSVSPSKSKKKNKANFKFKKQLSPTKLKLNIFPGERTWVRLSTGQIVLLQRKIRRYKWLLRGLIRIVMSLDYVNLVQNLLYIFTSLHQGVSIFDCSIIFIDVISISVFQFLIISVYLKYKNWRTQDIEDLVHIEIIFTAFPVQNGWRLSLPVSTWVNIFEVGRIVLFALLKTSNFVFGITSCVYNLSVIIFVIVKYFKHRKYFSKFIYPAFCMTILVEALFFLVVSIYTIFKYKLSESSGFITTKICMLLAWLVCSFSQTLFLIFSKNHEDVYLKNYPKYIPKPKPQIKTECEPVEKPKNDNTFPPRITKLHDKYNQVFPVNNIKKQKIKQVMSQRLVKQYYKRKVKVNLKKKKKKRFSKRTMAHSTRLWRSSRNAGEKHKLFANTRVKNKFKDGLIKDFLEKPKY